jgi:type IV secretory pathway TrbL component
MDLTDMGTVAWIAGTLVALVTVLFILWVAFRVANDQDIV